MAGSLHPVVPELITILTICGVLVVQYFLQRLEHAVRHKPAVREMLRSAYREVLILGLIAFVVFIFELAGSEEFDSEGSAALEFEHIHILLFIVAAFYILFTAGLIMDWQYTVRTWHSWERRYASDAAHTKLRNTVAHLRYKLGLDDAGRLQMASSSAPRGVCCGPAPTASTQAPASLRSVHSAGGDEGGAEAHEAPLAVRMAYMVLQPRTALRHARLATALKFADHRLQFMRDHAHLHLGEVRFSFAGYLNRASVHIFKDLVEIPVSFWMAAAWLLALDLYLRSVFQRYADNVDLRVVMLMLSASVALVSTAVRLKMYAVEHAISTQEAVSKASRRAMHEACMEAAAAARSAAALEPSRRSSRALLETGPDTAGGARGQAVSVARSHSAVATAGTQGPGPVIHRPMSVPGMDSAPQLPTAVPAGRRTHTPVIALPARHSSSRILPPGGAAAADALPATGRVRTVSLSHHSRGSRGASSRSLRSASEEAPLGPAPHGAGSGSATPPGAIALRRPASASKLRFPSQPPAAPGRPSLSSSAVAAEGAVPTTGEPGVAAALQAMRPPAVDHGARRRAQLGLFWCGRPSYIGRALQAAVLLAALLAALAVRVFVPAAGGGETGSLSGSASDVGLLVVVVIMLAVALVSLLFSLQSVIPSFILSMHIGDLVDKHLVEATVLAQLREEVTRYSRVHGGAQAAHPAPAGGTADPRAALKAALDTGGDASAASSTSGNTGGVIARQHTQGRPGQKRPPAWLSPGATATSEGALSPGGSSLSGFTGTQDTPSGALSPATHMALTNGVQGGYEAASDDEDDGSIRGVRGFSLTLAEGAEAAAAAAAAAAATPPAPEAQGTGVPVTDHTDQRPAPLRLSGSAAVAPPHPAATSLTIVHGASTPPPAPHTEHRGAAAHGIVPARRRAVSVMDGGRRPMRAGGSISASHAASAGRDASWGEHRPPTHRRWGSNLSAALISGLDGEEGRGAGAAAAAAAAAALARQAAWDGMSARQMQLLEIAAAVEAEAAAADEARGDSDSSSVSSEGSSTRSEYGSDDNEEGAWGDEEQGGWDGAEGGVDGVPHDTPVSRGEGTIQVSRGASAPSLRSSASAGGGRSRTASISRGATRGGDPLSTVAEGSISGSHGVTPLSDGATSPNSARGTPVTLHRRQHSSSGALGGRAAHRQHHHGHHHGHHLRKLRQVVPGVPDCAQGVAHACLERYRHDHCAASVPLMNVLLLLQYVLVAVLTANWLRDVPEARQALFSILLAATVALLLEALAVLAATYARERSHRHHGHRAWQGCGDLLSITWCCRCYGVKSARHDRCVRGQPAWATLADLLVLAAGTATVFASSHYHYVADNGREILDTPGEHIVPLTYQRASLAAAGVLVFRLPLRVLAPVCMRHHSHHHHQHHG